MRTQQPTSAASSAARFRSQLARLRRLIGSQSPAVRWSLALGVLGVVVWLGYLAAPVPSGSVFLRGQSFSSGDIIKISKALDAHQIDYRVDDQRRIEIPSDRIDEAKAVLAKIAIGPRSIDEIGNDGINSDPWAGPDDKAQRQKKAKEEILAAMIRNLDGIVSAYVSLNSPRARVGLGLRPGTNVRTTAFVWLETEGSRQIHHKTVQSIQNILVGNEPDLKPDTITVCDQKGHHYLVAGDPKSSTISATRAREEELDQRILDLIDFVRGVRVTVQLVAAPIPASLPVPVPVAVAAPATPPAPAVEPESPGSSMGVNTPLELEPESAHDPVLSTTPVVAASSLPEPAASKPELARVWVRVPRSYYLSKAELKSDPSPDRLQPFVKQTEDLIREAVAHVIPPELNRPAESPDLTIDIIPDEVPASVPLRSQVVNDPRGPLAWWVPAGAAVAGLLIVVSALGVRVLAWRRPAGRRASATLPGHYRSDAASDEPGSGPAERVRELIRLNPEAAASVLHRWIGREEPLG